MKSQCPERRGLGDAPLAESLGIQYVSDQVGNGLTDNYDGEKSLALQTTRRGLLMSAEV
jgi:hypothetical protein